MHCNRKVRVALIVIMCFAMLSVLSACGSEDASVTDGAGKADIPPKEDKEVSIEERAKDILENMTIDQKTSQVLLARCPMRDADEAMETYQFGGYVLYEKDFMNEDDSPLTPGQVKAKLKKYNDVSGIPPLLAVDEEGGTVVRVTSNEKLSREGRCKSPQTIWKSEGEKALYKDVESKSKMLLEYGINVNLAPVSDVPTDKDAIMYGRSMGTDPEKTGDLIAGIIKKMDEVNIGSVLKHFPGYGNNKDTHATVAVDERSREEYEKEDFVAFRKGIEAGADAVMTSHIVAKGMGDELPASLSQNVISILRKEMGFDGVILTDDLWMIDKDKLGISDDLAPKAIIAGNDMVITTEFGKDKGVLMKAIKNGRLKEERLDTAVMRILIWKIKLNIIQ